jgi:hypothetical protein
MRMINGIKLYTMLFGLIKNCQIKIKKYFPEEIYGITIEMKK